MGIVDKLNSSSLILYDPQSIKSDATNKPQLSTIKKNAKKIETNILILRNVNILLLFCTKNAKNNKDIKNQNHENF